jgi:FSR family fosmidomycin resistance protein-like MFS transporter
MTTSAISTELPSLRQDAFTIGLVGLAHSISHFCHMLLAPLFPVFIKEFGLSFAEVGSLVTIFFVISGVGQALSGFVVDRFGARPVLFGAMASFVLATLAASQATGYAGLALAAVFAGVGNSPFHPVDFSILNQRVSPKRLGYAFSVHGLSGNLGWAIAPVFLVGLSAVFGSWRWAYLCAAGCIAAVMLLLWVYRDLLSTTVVRHDKAVSGDHSLAFLKLPVVWWCFGFFFCGTMTLAVIQSFGTPILQAVHHLSFEQATGVVSAYMLASAVGMFIGGFVVSRHPTGSDRVVTRCMAVGAVLLALCSTGWLGSAATVGVLVLTGLAVGIGGPSRDLMIKKATPKGATGRVYGTVYSGLDIGFAVSPLVFGLLMDAGHHGWTLFGAALMLALAAVTARVVGHNTNTRI